MQQVRSRAVRKPPAGGRKIPEPPALMLVELKGRGPIVEDYESQIASMLSGVVERLVHKRCADAVAALLGGDEQP